MLYLIRMIFIYICQHTGAATGWARAQPLLQTPRSRDRAASRVLLRRRGAAGPTGALNGGYRRRMQDCTPATEAARSRHVTTARPGEPRNVGAISKNHGGHQHWKHVHRTHRETLIIMRLDQDQQNTKPSRLFSRLSSTTKKKE